MSETMTAPIPVMISRHTVPLPEGYGALIGWETGERCRVFSRSGRPTVNATILDGTMKWHKDAPRIERTCRGPGQWVYEVQLDCEDSPRALPADQILLPPPPQETNG